ncbi:SOS response-associated peptidase family protein [Pseudomonas hamedanensis]|uniref:SOS response-associated peptidase family protein n=1 Tax=Pseudomonas hamedanensis TaxID=2745504 RepID=A0A9E6TG96_9PSED|nr:SOS response-associated peptidase family protein [Pseudomonas hamedanensis]QXI17285.1 SOS response-associated peptidase family protein [Pseudomonas hamedanensis]
MTRRIQSVKTDKTRRGGSFEVPLPGVFAMCEYIVQHDVAEGFEALLAATQNQSIGSAIAVAGSSLHRTCEPQDSQHVIKPNMQVDAIRSRNGVLECIKVRWGWKPFWSMGTMPPMTHLPLHLVMRSKVFDRVKRDGRMLIAVDGWYEACESEQSKNNHRLSYTTSRQSAPIFLAALAQASEQFNGCDGLTLVTHDDSATKQQRLLAFTAEDARVWLRPDLQWEQAQELAMHMALAEPQLEHVLASPRSLRGR